MVLCYNFVSVNQYKTNVYGNQKHLNSKGKATKTLPR